MLGFEFLEKRPIIIAIAGSNGAGKSTFFASHLADCGLRFVNADDIALELDIGPYEAAEAAAAIRDSLVECGESFIFDNDILTADYPEACFPIQALDGISNRANGQLYNGKRTQIGWTAKEIVLPTIAGSKASGAIIKVTGLTGRIRGMKFKRPDGKTVRPSLVVLDDPQTDESARSLSQCANREASGNGTTERR